MCDYSLHAQVTRLAVEGEKLVVKRFRGGTIGLAPAIWPPEPEKVPSGPRPPWWSRLFSSLWSTDESDSMPAVCVPPGAELALEGIPPPLQKRVGVAETERVVFTQVSMEADVHRDAIRFRNGGQVSLQELFPGQRVTVLCTGGDRDDVTVPEVFLARY